MNARRTEAAKREAEKKASAPPPAPQPAVPDGLAMTIAVVDGKDHWAISFYDTRAQNGVSATGRSIPAALRALAKEWGDLPEGMEHLERGHEKRA